MCDVIPFERKHFPLECTVQSDIEFIDLKTFIRCFSEYSLSRRLCSPPHTDIANRSKYIFGNINDWKQAKKAASISSRGSGYSSYWKKKHRNNSKQQTVYNCLSLSLSLSLVAITHTPVEKKKQPPANVNVASSFVLRAPCISFNDAWSNDFTFRLLDSIFFVPFFKTYIKRRRMLAHTVDCIFMSNFYLIKKQYIDKFTSNRPTFCSHGLHFGSNSKWIIISRELFWHWNVGVRVFGTVSNIDPKF